MIKSVYYFHAIYGYEGDKGWEESHEYGFIAAENFLAAAEQITESFRKDLISFTLEEIGDDLISTNNKEIAESFKKSLIKTHYGEEEE